MAKIVFLGSLGIFLFCATHRLVADGKSFEKNWLPDFSDHQRAENGSLAYSLIARPPPLSAAFLKKLAYMGIELTFNAPFCPPSESQAPSQREGGILFIIPFNQNEEILRKWFRRTLIKPSETVLINHLLLPPQKRLQKPNRAN